MRKLNKPKWQSDQERSNKLKFVVAVSVLALPVLLVGIYVGASNLPVWGAFERSEKTIFVKPGGDLQAAIGAAQPGDTIILQSGADYAGPFHLPKKSGAEWITFKGSASESALPKEGERVSPEKHSGVMPKLHSETTQPVIITSEGAHHYRFVGIEFGGTEGGKFNIIQIGTTEEESVEELPHHIEFDRVIVRATSPEGQRRGIAANGRSIVIKNSHISGIRRKENESQAIAVWATDGPVTITNNYLEAAGENILFGGAGSKMKLVPTNCVVSGNTLTKPLEWRKEGWLVKNLFEIKNGRRIRVSNNIMSNNWANGQDGTAILFTVREDNGDASLIEDVVFENNLIRGSGGALNVFGSEGSGGKNLTIRNNFFDDISGKKWGGSGQFLKVSDWNGLTIENNTVIHDGNIASAYGKPVKDFVMRNNIVFNNEYGLIGDSVSPGIETLARYFPRAEFSSNAIVGGKSASYGTDNFFPGSLKELGLGSDEEAGVARKFRKKGTEGKNIGFQKSS